MNNGIIMNEGNNVMNSMSVDMGLLEELNRYKNNVSVYPTNQTNKNGIPVYGMAFYHEDVKGNKKRKVVTGTSEEVLWGKRSVFLTDLYNQKQIDKEIANQAAISPMPIMAAHQSIPSVVTCNITITQAVDSFLVYYKPTVARPTYLAEVTCANHVKRILGNKLVSDITFIDFQTLVNEISNGRNGKQAAPKTVRNIITSFKRLMKYCRKQKWITLDDLDLITSDIRIPTAITDSDHEELVKKAKFLEYEETGAVLRILEQNKRYYLVARILFLTGLRPQEFFGLEKKDLFPEENYISVRQALVVNEKVNADDRAFIIGTTKNKYSRRRVPAIPKLFDYLRELEKLLVESGSRKNSFKKGNGNMVIVDSNGNIVDEHSFGVNMRKHIQRHSDSLKLTLGMPRHMYQDYLDGLDAKFIDIEKAVGHVVDNTAERYYKTKDYYVNRLLPFIEKMEINIENAYKNK